MKKYKLVLKFSLRPKRETELTTKTKVKTEVKNKVWFLHQT